MRHVGNAILAEKAEIFIPIARRDTGRFPGSGEKLRAWLIGTEHLQDVGAAPGGTEPGAFSNCGLSRGRAYEGN